MPTHDFTDIGDVLNFGLLRGIIATIDSATDTCTVNVGGDIVAALLYYHCTPAAELRDNGAILGASAGFKVDDEVIVLINSDKTIIKVIGHTDGIRRCGGQIVVNYKKNGQFRVAVCMYSPSGITLTADYSNVEYYNLQADIPITDEDAIGNTPNSNLPYIWVKQVRLLKNTGTVLEPVYTPATMYLVWMPFNYVDTSLGHNLFFDLKTYTGALTPYLYDPLTKFLWPISNTTLNINCDGSYLYFITGAGYLTKLGFNADGNLVVLSAISADPADYVKADGTVATEIHMIGNDFTQAILPNGFKSYGWVSYSLEQQNMPPSVNRVVAAEGVPGNPLYFAGKQRVWKAESSGSSSQVETTIYDFGAFINGFIFSGVTAIYFGSTGTADYSKPNWWDGPESDPPRKVGVYENLSVPGFYIYLYWVSGAVMSDLLRNWIEGDGGTITMYPPGEAWSANKNIGSSINYGDGGVKIYPNIWKHLIGNAFYFTATNEEGSCVAHLPY